MFPHHSLSIFRSFAMSAAAPSVTPYSMVFVTAPTKDVADKLATGIGEANIYITTHMYNAKTNKSNHFSD
jgi:hypothetical protein